ncbi:hypothetical protein QQS21_005686 [Conoideocrella luteorostrata]|uniref:DUF7924 domain-containing protein n=1 Tax=Conoideocrella luteorostrata TaxID=1105319 RepID=A0AAJ0G0R6_9HYPO|nr:hypothetical protein QQS21_005686 [Conoideocrella luteorostrata]
MCSFPQKLELFTPTSRLKKHPSSASNSLQHPAASFRNCRQQNTDILLARSNSSPAKWAKSTSPVCRASNFSPQFWDKLSKIWLTPRALRELNRRNNAKLRPRTKSAALISTTLARFARRGGPNLQHLQGCPEPNHVKMIFSRSLRSSSQSTQSHRSSPKPKRKPSSAYDRNFEQDLIDHSIYPLGYKYPHGSTPEPSNLDDIVQALAVPQASPPSYSRSTFTNFAQANDRVISESEVISNILPTIHGNINIPSEGNFPFTSLDSITDETTVKAVPDLYDRSYPRDINTIVRTKLSSTIIPTSHRHALAVPKFFVEAKAPRAGADVTKRQACLDGAIGARAMHSLQNYGEEELVFDGKAHALSSTYHDGMLKMYAHHVTGAAAEGERPEYHMTQIGGWQMTGDIDAFRCGATAFRNARDLAQQQRETFCGRE